MTDDISLMRHLYDMAKKAGKAGEVPVAAMVVDGQGTILATDHNQVEKEKNILRHAEILVLEKAILMRGEKILPDCTLLVTLEPCAMCAAAIAMARIKKLVFGGYDKKSGGVLSGARIFDNDNCHHVPKIIDGIMAKECESLMTEFFKDKR